HWTAGRCPGGPGSPRGGGPSRRSRRRSERCSPWSRSRAPWPGSDPQVSVCSGPYSPVGPDAGRNSWWTPCQFAAGSEDDRVGPEEHPQLAHQAVLAVDGERVGELDDGGLAEVQEDLGVPRVLSQQRLQAGGDLVAHRRGAEADAQRWGRSGGDAVERGDLGGHQLGQV